MRDSDDALFKRLSDGEKFAVLAGEVSVCSSKINGGRLGWFTVDQVAPEIGKAIVTMQPGDLSGVVEDSFGFHIIRLNERKASSVEPLTEVKEKISRLVKQEKGLTVLQRYVAALRDSARVEILPF